MTNHVCRTDSQAEGKRKKQEKSKMKSPTGIKELQHYQESPKAHLKHSAVLSLLNPPVMKLKCAQHGSCVPSQKREEIYFCIFTAVHNDHFVSHGHCSSTHGSEEPFRDAGKHTHPRTSVLLESHSWPQVVTHKWLLSDFSSSTSTQISSWLLPQPSPSLLGFSPLPLLTPGFCPLSMHQGNPVRRIQTGCIQTS